MEVPENKWVNQPDYDQAVAGVLLIDADGNIIGQHRDGNTPNSPNKASMFGGMLEPIDATAAEGAAREVNEETNRHVSASELEPFMEYLHKKKSGKIEKVYMFVSRGHTIDGLEVYEGQGYHVIKDLNDPLIAPAVQNVIDAWFAKPLDARCAPAYPKGNEHS